MKKKKDKFITIFLILVLLAGLSLLLYPSLSDYWNSFHQSRAIAEYVAGVENLEDEEKNQIWADAEAYNQSLWVGGNVFQLSDEQRSVYEQQLDPSGLGIMGYVEIPAINCSLPIYHGTDESVLQIAVGHLEWSSLPVGGESTHCVLSGHRGLPSAKLFSNLDQLVVGDVFFLRVMDEVLTYEVDQILIVEPHVTDALEIVEGKDYCTLVTCTPYGVNTHRLLVRGHRVDTILDQTVVVHADAVRIAPYIAALALAIPLLFVLLLILLIFCRRRPAAVTTEDIRKLSKK